MWGWGCSTPAGMLRIASCALPWACEHAFSFCTCCVIFVSVFAAAVIVGCSCQDMRSTAVRLLEGVHDEGAQATALGATAPQHPVHTLRTVLQVISRSMRVCIGTSFTSCMPKDFSRIDTTWNENLIDSHSNKRPLCSRYGPLLFQTHPPAQHVGTDWMWRRQHGAAPAR